MNIRIFFQSLASGTIMSKFLLTASLLAYCLAVSIFMEVAAADTNTDIAKCAADANSISRLECFDSLSERLGVASTKSSTSTVSKWQVNKETSPIDDSTNVTISLDANSSITGWPKKMFTPTLIVRCKEGKTAAYIITGMSPQVEYRTDEATVTLRFDKEEATKYQTSKSTDGEALFFEESIKLIKKMIPHKTMLFGFVPFNSSPVLTTFELGGLSEAVKPVKEICKW